MNSYRFKFTLADGTTGYLASVTPRSKGDLIFQGSGEQACMYLHQLWDRFPAHNFTLEAIENA